jgi:hypothetical protein
MPITSAKPRALSRLDIRRRNDRATNSAVLEYTGRALRFHERVYGFADGVFLVVSYDEMPFPPGLRALSDDLGVPVEALSVAKTLKTAAVDALLAEGMVKAPQMLHDFAEPEVFWQPWDARELERRHVVALARVVELEALAERELRLRAAKVVLEPVSEHRASTTAHLYLEESPVPGRAALSGLTPESAESEIVTEILSAGRPVDPAFVTVARVQAAVAQARESELAQRLPNGARRALQKLVRAQYVIRCSDAPSVRGSLVEAMQDAETMAAGMRKVAGDDVEVSVIDWDGEWPVVVRRYGAGGRTVYRVEDALKRAGIEEKAA